MFCLRTTPEKVAASGGLDDTRLQLRMAVGAQENALGGLPPDGLQRPGQTAISEPELLLLAVAMVKLERAGPAVIAADLAATARFLDKDLL